MLGPNTHFHVPIINVPVVTSPTPYPAYYENNLAMQPVITDCHKLYHQASHGVVFNGYNNTCFDPHARFTIQRDLIKKTFELLDVFRSKNGRWKNPLLYKTSLCDYYKRGMKCRFGDQCWYAHGVEELRFMPRLDDLRKEVSEQEANAAPTAVPCMMVLVPVYNGGSNPNPEHVVNQKHQLQEMALQIDQAAHINHDVDGLVQQMSQTQLSSRKVKNVLPNINLACSSSSDYFSNTEFGASEQGPMTPGLVKVKNLIGFETLVNSPNPVEAKSFVIPTALNVDNNFNVLPVEHSAAIPIGSNNCSKEFNQNFTHHVVTL